MSLCLSHDRPGDLVRTFLRIDNPDIEGNTAASHDGPADHKNQRILSKGAEKSAGYGQKIGFTMLRGIVDPSRKAFFPTGRVGSVTDLLSDLRQLCAAARRHDCTDKGCKRGEMLGLTASDTRHELLKCGHNSWKGFL